MVGSSKNRDALAAAINLNGRYARSRSRGIELGTAPGATLPSEIVWNNGRRGLYLMIRGPHQDLSQNINGNFRETLAQVEQILAQVGL